MGKTIKMNSRPKMRGRPPKCNSMISYPSRVRVSPQVEHSSVQEPRSETRCSKSRRYRKKYFPHLAESDFVKVSKKTLRLLNLKPSSKLKEKGRSVYSVPIKFICPKELQICTTPLDDRVVALLKTQIPADVMVEPEVSTLPFEIPPSMTLEPSRQAAGLTTCTFDVESSQNENLSSKGEGLSVSSSNQPTISDEFNSFVNYILNDELDCDNNALIPDCFGNLEECDIETTSDFDDIGSSDEIEICKQTHVQVNLHENEPNNPAECTQIIGNSGDDLRPTAKLRLVSSSRTHEIQEDDDRVQPHDLHPSINDGNHRHNHRRDALSVSPEIKNTSNQEERLVILDDLDVLQIMVDPSDELRLPPDLY